jgi:hypothetical protein
MMIENASHEEMAETYESFTIEAAPVYTLAACFAAKPDDDFDSTQTRAEGVMERFRKALYLCDDEQLDFVRFAIAQSESKAALTAACYYPLRCFVFDDSVFVFSHEGGYYLSLPTELREIFDEVLANQNYAAINAKNREMNTYAKALLNLYGAYEMDWFVEVWNHHHKDKITQQEAESFLCDQANFHSDFYFYDWFVVHDCLDEDEFEELWEATEELDYYLPTKSVIREYAKRGYGDDSTPAEHALDAFLAEHIKDGRDLDDVQGLLHMSVEQMESAESIQELLEDAKAPLEDEAFRERFERLYNNLREDTHLWPLKGFTPYQYQTETGKRIAPFKLPKLKPKKKKR